jgi:hypothetical protein
MTDKEIKKAVTEQIINMFDNNILNEYGTESFTGWLEDGDVFINNGMSEEDTEKAMEYARKVEGALDVINQVLDVTYQFD